MNYEQLRETVKNGDIVFLTIDKKSLFSRLTGFVTSSTLTHVCFVFWFRERLMLVESTTHGGVRIVNASIYKDREFEVKKSPIEWVLLEDTALLPVGTVDYGWFSALYIGIREFLFIKFGLKLPNNKNNRNMACSEYVATVLNFDDCDISPGKLFNILK